MNKIKAALVGGLSLTLINLTLPAGAVADIPKVTVMSRNIYLGADVGKALELIPNLPAAAQFMWDQVKQTDFKKRAKILAKEIFDNSPDVIGLQEATIWYCKKYPWSKKVEVFNFTEQLLAELGGQYQLAKKDGIKALNPGFSIDPIPFLTKVVDKQTFPEVFNQDSAACGFQTGDALLIKNSLAADLIQVGNSEYEVNYPIVPTIMTVYRGYSWADIKIQNQPVRFVTTHLESLWDENKIPNSAKQATQLVNDLAETKMPIIVMGDFNADPRDPRLANQANPGLQPVQSQNCPAKRPTCNAYLIMLDAGYQDSGPDSLDPKNFTWGLDALLKGADPKRAVAAKEMGNSFGFTDRLDYIFSKNGTQVLESKIVGQQAEYGSDHAGVVSDIAILNQSDQISAALPEHSPFPISFWQFVFIALILILTIISWRRRKKKLLQNS